MSVPLVPGYFESRGSPEHEKDQTDSKVIGNQGDACAEERQASERSKVARPGVHSRSRLGKGSDQAAPPFARVDGLEPP